MVRQTFFSTIVIGIGTRAVGLCSGKEFGLTLNYSTSKFIAKEHGVRAVDGKLLKGKQ